MELDNKIINKIYDQYQIQDFSIADPTGALLPKREITLDKTQVLIRKLQEATNDIIRKRIQFPPVEQILRASLGGETIVEGIPLKKQMIVAQAGGTGGYIFPVTDGPLASSLEQILGLSPDLTGLDDPPFIDCDAILDKVKQTSPEVVINDPEEVDASGSQASAAGSDSGSSGGGGDDSEDSGTDEGDDEDEPLEEDDSEDESDEEEDEFDETDEVAVCAQIELTWLKIILILVKILMIIQKIITLVLAILFPIIEIVRLAVGAWINPPNIAKIVQLIIQLVIAIILMILAMILQMIWNLLNLDCVCDQTASMIKQITKAMSTFASIMGAYNSLGVNLANQINRELLNPLEGLADDLNKGKENWMKLRDQFRDMFSEKGLNDMMEAAKADLLKGAKTTALNSEGGKKIMGIVVDAKHMFNAADKVKAQYEKMAAAAKKDDLFAMKTGAGMVQKKGNRAITKFKGLVGIDMTKKDES